MGIAFILNGDVMTKIWNAPGITPDSHLLPFGLQHKLPRANVVWIGESEKKTCQAVVACPIRPQRWIWRDGREAAKHISTNILNQRDCVRVAVASTVKVASAETVATSSPQKSPSFGAEFIEQWRNASDDQ
jgi:hypothetical protein